MVYSPPVKSETKDGKLEKAEEKRWWIKEEEKS